MSYADLVVESIKIQQETEKAILLLNSDIARSFCNKLVKLVPYHGKAVESHHIASNTALRKAEHYVDFRISYGFDFMHHWEVGAAIEAMVMAHIITLNLKTVEEKQAEIVFRTQVLELLKQELGVR